MLCANTSEVCIGGRGMNVPVLPEVTRLRREMRGFVQLELLSCGLKLIIFFATRLDGALSVNKR